MKRRSATESADAALLSGAPPERRKWFSAPTSTKAKQARQRAAAAQAAADVAKARSSTTDAEGGRSRSPRSAMRRTRDATLENEDEAQRWVWSQQMRPPVPRRCPQVLQELLNRCWDQDPMKVSFRGVLCVCVCMFYILYLPQVVCIPPLSTRLMTTALLTSDLSLGIHSPHVPTPALLPPSPRGHRCVPHTHTSALHSLRSASTSRRKC